MGPGCKTVSRVGPEKVVGTWKDGRQGTFYRSRTAMAPGGRLEKSGDAGKFDGYAPLLSEIVKFFQTRQAARQRRRKPWKSWPSWKPPTRASIKAASRSASRA